MCGNLPSGQEDSHLYKLVKTFQIYSHAKSCRKYKIMKCFKFGHFFTEKTMVVMPLQSMLSQVEKFEILNKKKQYFMQDKKLYLYQS